MEIINSIQKLILTIFGKISESEQFYLTGGTALSEFYLKHRRSNDLDFFTSTEELILPFSHHIEEALKTEGISVQRQRGFRSFVELLAKKDEESTIIHIAEDSAFRFEQPKEFVKYNKLKVDSLIDIASNKLLALFARATLRDFIDVYTLVTKSFFTAEKLTEKAKNKDSGFDLYWLGIALERIKTFNKDSLDMLLLIELVEFDELLNFFNNWRRKINEELKI